MEKVKAAFLFRTINGKLPIPGHWDRRLFLLDAVLQPFCAPLRFGRSLSQGTDSWHFPQPCRGAKRSRI